MKKLLDHDFFEKLEYPQVFDSEAFDDLLQSIKNIEIPKTQTELIDLSINLMQCQRGLYVPLLFHLEPDDLYKIKDLSLTIGNIFERFDAVFLEAMETKIKSLR